MSSRSLSRPDDSAVSWFGEMSLLHRPRLWIPIMVVLGLVAYHLAWLVSGRAYSMTAALVVLGCGGVVVCVWSLIHMTRLRLSTCVRVCLSLLGCGAVILGIDLVVGSAQIGSPVTTDVVGTLTLLGGIFICAAGIYLKTNIDRLSQMRSVDRHIAEERFSLNGADAVLRRYRNFTPGTNRLVDVCRPYVTVDDLHFVAYHMDGKCRFYLDVFDDARVDRFSDQVVSETRRERYLQQGRYLHELVVSLNTSFQDIDSGILIRVVLDVERGAFYYYWVDERRFVVGVTLDQEMVDRADHKMVGIIDGIRSSLGHRRIGDLER